MPHSLSEGNRSTETRETIKDDVFIQSFVSESCFTETDDNDYSDAAEINALFQCDKYLASAELTIPQQPFVSNKIGIHLIALPPPNSII